MHRKPSFLQRLRQLPELIRRLKRPGVLVVQDFAQDGDGVPEQLDEAGYNVVVTHSLNDAYQTLERAQFSLVAVDITGRDAAIEAAGNLTAYLAWTNVGVVVCGDQPDCDPEQTPPNWEGASVASPSTSHLRPKRHVGI